jgi:two-component system, OmpR family, phosphate regulon response regulator PhoB
MRSSGTPSSLYQACILVVDDEPSILDPVAAALTQEGYEVLTAQDGREALDLIRASCNREIDTQIDLVILDLMLPILSGLDLCRMIRQENNPVLILILSARGSETDVVVGLEVGADDYLTKPFGLRELIARCRALLRRQMPVPVQEQPTLQYKDVVLYAQEYRVTVRGNEIKLSPKEFSLLELFLTHPKRVFSREQLLEPVDVHIRWLREKLEIDPSNPEYLITVRGFGYRFG